MELQVECCEGTTLPQGCYVGVRVGDVLKQGRYEPKRSYHFPKAGRRTAKIDIYHHVGSCSVQLDPEADSTHHVDVQSLDPAFGPMSLNVSCLVKATDVSKEKREAKAVAMKKEAKEYLAKHSIEDRLADVVKSLLKEQPADPTEFICRMLQQSKGNTAKPVATTPARVTEPTPTPTVETPSAEKTAPALAPEPQRLQPAQRAVPAAPAPVATQPLAPAPQPSSAPPPSAASSQAGAMRAAQQAETPAPAPMPSDLNFVGAPCRAFNDFAPAGAAFVANSVTLLGVHNTLAIGLGPSLLFV
mmetsp:Transcript_7859/g.22595  ORF Transcript_7859/g.22595 Transcript_7859/m.22595 type:complete len:301 (-) Transcript_7859:22-924(-)